MCADHPKTFSRFSCDLFKNNVRYARSLCASHRRSRATAENTFSSVRRTNYVKLSEMNPYLWNSTNFACGFCFHATTLTAELSNQKRFGSFLSAISPPTRLGPRLQSICEFVLFKNTYASSGGQCEQIRYSPTRPTSGPDTGLRSLRDVAIRNRFVRAPTVSGYGEGLEGKKELGNTIRAEVSTEISSGIGRSSVSTVHSTITFRRRQS